MTKTLLLLAIFALLLCIVSAKHVKVSVDVELPHHGGQHHNNHHNNHAEHHNNNEEIAPMQEEHEEEIHQLPEPIQEPKFTPDGHEILNEADFDEAAAGPIPSALTDAGTQTSRWLKKFKKTWTSSELVKRSKVLKANLIHVVQHNHNPHRAYDLGLNQYSDMTEAEFKAKITTYKPDSRQNHPKNPHANANTRAHTQHKAAHLPHATEASIAAFEAEMASADLDSAETLYAPRPIDIDPIDGIHGKTTQAHHDSRFNIGQLGGTAAIDWSSHTVPPRDQAQCGSCWAFSTTDALSANWAITHNVQPPLLSPQFLVDCDNKPSGWFGLWGPSNHGCNGGFPGVAFAWLADNNHVYESDYAYIGRETGTCRDARKSPVKGAGNGFNHVSGVEQMKAELRFGPMVVALNGASPVFQAYAGGILDDPGCTPEQDHAVLLVGYGSENGIPYWIVKNSWTAFWGEGGFIRIVMGKNMCAIENDGYRPTV